IVFSKDSRSAYVVNRGKNRIDVIDTASRTLKKSIPVGNRPEVAALTPDGKFLYVANSGGGSVSIIDTAGEKVTKTLEGVGRYPWAIDMAGGSNFCH
ncbi:MAG TPA: beta-propeller fold lactonase family protein, partial [Candidatus Manganitrophaceae bacterium]